MQHPSSGEGVIYDLPQVLLEDSTYGHLGGCAGVGGERGEDGGCYDPQRHVPAEPHLTSPAREREREAEREREREREAE